MLNRTELKTNIEKLRLQICRYIGPICDCKFGANHLHDATYEDSGCPELHQVVHLLEWMNDDEFTTITERPFKPERLKEILEQLKNTPSVGASLTYNHLYAKINGGRDL